jgi:hypothetical protein
LPRRDSSDWGLIASSCHSMTLPRTE